jgi:hypothetical protein
VTADRLSAFAIAVAASSVNAVMRCSVSGGKRSRSVPAATEPQSDPSTIIGTATAQRIPRASSSRETSSA